MMLTGTIELERRMEDAHYCQPRNIRHCQHRTNHVNCTTDAHIHGSMVKVFDRRCPSGKCAITLNWHMLTVEDWGHRDTARVLQLHHCSVLRNVWPTHNTFALRSPQLWCLHLAGYSHVLRLIPRSPHSCRNWSIREREYHEHGSNGHVLSP